MKNYFFLVCLLLCATPVFGQNDLELKGYFGFSGALAGPKEELVGASSVDLEGFKEFGLILSTGIGGKFRLNGGLTYAFANVNFYPNYPPCFNCLSISYAHNPDFRMLSIPVFA